MLLDSSGLIPSTHFKREESSFFLPVNNSFHQGVAIPDSLAGRNPALRNGLYAKAAVRQELSPLDSPRLGHGPIWPPSSGLNKASFRDWR